MQVRVLLDANGCKKMGEGVERAAAGRRLPGSRTSTALSCATSASYNQRDHRKIVVIDGRIAFVGGHCIVDEWLGDGAGQGPLRDVSVRLRGPDRARVQSVFSENWVEETGELFAGDDVFPELEPAGDVDDARRATRSPRARRRR